MRNRVLIIDDDPAIQKVLSISLENDGFEVAIAGSALAAFDILSRNEISPDCILLDIRMPKMTGEEALPIFKKNYPLIPVIMLTAMTDLDTAIGAMKNGAFDYLTKPFRKIQLLETIRKAIRFRNIAIENERLTRENMEYQKSLEQKVTERTEELFKAYLQLKKTNLETVRVLAETIEAKDHYTRGHCNRVRLLSSTMAQFMGFSKEKIASLEYGALLHDIGKIGIPEEILNKNGTLTEEERKAFQQHTLIGENILKTVDFFKMCLPIIRHHHERFDGKGYPDGAKMNEIDLSARIVSVSDAYDAMTSTRPYRIAMSHATAL
ncbi:MAG: HD domain-containing phosphohydrolase, partial [Spirochaetota bacterium]